MIYRYLKRMRVIISLILFMFIAFYFIDDYEILPAWLIDWLPEIQFVPALMNSANGSVNSIIILIALLISVALIGRVYCSSICPLGIYQDIVIRIKKWIRPKTRFRYSKGYKTVHYIVSVISVIVALSGIISLLLLLDPYSNFGRMASETFKVPLLKGLAWLALKMQQNQIYWLYPINYEVVPAGLLYATGFTLLITSLSAWKGRFFCNFLCPVGGIFGLISRFSFYKLKFEEKSCTSCGKCMHSCKAECINIKDKTVDFSRCIACYNCVQSCESQSIKYSPSVSIKKKTENETLQSATGTNERRRLLREGATLLSLLTIPAFAQQGKGKGKGHGGRKGKFRSKGPVTPPGSISLKHFNENCTACHLCVAKCPSNVLQPTLTDYGLHYIMQPKMHYTISYCGFNCTVCGEICPTGAIQELSKEEKHVCQIGVVHFAKKHCVVVSEGTACGSCSEHCPTQAVYMVPYDENLTIPEIKPEICVGCGACEYACPVLVPHKAIFVVDNKVHQVADKPEEEEQEFNLTDDFPF
jgi:ferredoxin